MRRTHTLACHPKSQISAMQSTLLILSMYVLCLSSRASVRRDRAWQRTPRRGSLAAVAKASKVHPHEDTQAAA